MVKGIEQELELWRLEPPENVSCCFNKFFAPTEKYLTGLLKDCRGEA